MAEIIDLNVSSMDADFKDASPMKTVERIKGILSEYDIKTIETWSESGVEHCYSLRLNVDGTSFGVNGKGLTKEFALASAYGELMERMQQGLFADSSVQKIGHYNEVIGEDELVSAEELFEQLPEWYEYIAQRVYELDGVKRSGMDILSCFADENGKLASMKYFSLKRGRAVYIPRELRGVVCGSNGGAAGNTMEEAIVQALSEIVERGHKQRAIREGISLPDIPEEELRKYKTAYSIITSLRDAGLRVSVKDCSLGERFPVACVCCIDEETGRYHTHFGAYPHMEIAIERALTESFQGRRLEGFAKNEDFIYNLEDALSYRSIYKDLKKGNYDKSIDFFIGECKYSYNGNAGFNGKNNAELLSELVEYFDQKGYEILVHDSAGLGFPTFNVLVPRFSEVVFHSLSSKHKSFANAKAAIKTLRSPSEAGFDDYLLLLMHIAEMKKLSDLDTRLFSFATCAKLAMKCDKNQDSYMMSASLTYIYYAMGNLTQALSFLNKMIPLAKKEDVEYLLCLKRYMAMRLNNYSEEKAKKLLSMFHREKTVERISAEIREGKNPFDPFVLHCDCKSCEKCYAQAYCRQRYTMFLISLVHEKAKALDFEELAENLKKYCIGKN